MVSVARKNLKRGMVIVCPVSGLTEKISTNNPYPGGRRAVRTSRHDHYRPAAEKVEVVEPSDGYTDRHGNRETQW